MTTDTNIKTCSSTASERIPAVKRPQNYRAPVDVFETETGYIVLADMPGASSETIEISVDDTMLTITAEVADRYEDLGAMRFQEYGVGDFHRSFRIGDGIDADGIAATYRDGVLEVNLPKAATVKSRRIDIRSD